MTSRDFCYWLQGHFELANPQELSARETALIKQHLALVFKHEIDPSMPDPTGELQAIHDGTPFPLPVAHDGTPFVDNDMRYRC
jgi:hypothetical protein